MDSSESLEGTGGLTCTVGCTRLRQLRQHHVHKVSIGVSQGCHSDIVLRLPRLGLFAAIVDVLECRIWLIQPRALSPCQEQMEKRKRCGPCQAQHGVEQDSGTSVSLTWHKSEGDSTLSTIPAVPASLTIHSFPTAGCWSLGCSNRYRPPRHHRTSAGRSVAPAQQCLTTKGAHLHPMSSALAAAGSRNPRKTINLQGFVMGLLWVDYGFPMGLLQDCPVNHTVLIDACMDI